MTLLDGPFLWYLNRATGLVLLVALSLSVVLGVLALRGRHGGLLPGFVSQALHRNLALVSVLALVVHVASAVLDTYVDIRWWQALVPLGASYEPLWLGLGTLSLDLVVVVVLTSLLRTRLAPRAWHAVHLTAWLAWVVAVVHGLGIGTDLSLTFAGPRWSVLPTLGCVGAVTLALLGRLVLLLRDRRRDRLRDRATPSAPQRPLARSAR